MTVGSQAGHDAWRGISDAFNTECPARELLEHITGRWGMLILTALGAGPRRYSELHATIGGISEKMLSQTLRTLVRDGLVARTVEPTAPPRVSYDLTPLGRGLIDSMQSLLDWIRQHAIEVVTAQHQYDQERR
ncbi:putative transcriptional regulator, HxlR family [Nocardia nova SH22a]|uniref:Putative transcriptional regulator, HxlR family n=1 Tax=Nocardia nova SH22a TaxID=1415166 RepID=W5T915_9NOCA|nr:helix-turn-helix domain-containing protein [Nocardia nova]AHH15712.1 putative transcriptional regulator, HxlR family [Nocardia nova SH22a]